MANALMRLAYERAIEASVEVEIQLRKDVEGGKPILLMLAKARKDAAEAMVGLCFADPYDAVAVSKLQNKVRVFDSIVEMIVEIIRGGHEAEYLLNADEREDLAGIISSQLADVAPEIVGVQEETVNYDS